MTGILNEVLNSSCMQLPLSLRLVIDYELSTDLFNIGKLV